MAWCLIKHRDKFALIYAVKTYWGSGDIDPCILNFGTGWRWVVSFTPWDKDLGTPWLGGSVGPRAGLDAVA